MATIGDVIEIFKLIIEGLTLLFSKFFGSAEEGEDAATEETA